MPRSGSRCTPPITAIIARAVSRRFGAIRQAFAQWVELAERTRECVRGLANLGQTARRRGRRMVGVLGAVADTYSWHAHFPDYRLKSKAKQTKEQNSTENLIEGSSRATQTKLKRNSNVHVTNRQKFQDIW